MMSFIRAHTKSLQTAALLMLTTGNSESVVATSGASKSPLSDSGLSALQVPSGTSPRSRASRVAEGAFPSEHQMGRMGAIARLFRLEYPERGGSQSRKEAFLSLDEQGLLALVGLTPTERKSILWCAEYGTGAVLPVIDRAQLSGKSKQTTESYLADAIKKAASRAESEGRQTLSSRDTEYARGLQFLYSLMAKQDQHYLSAEQKLQAEYLKNISLGHVALLRQAHGACLLYDRLPSFSEAKVVTGSFICRVRGTITDQDKEVFPYLAEHFSFASVSVDFPDRLAATSLISLMGIVLWRRARLRAGEVNEENCKR